MHSRVLQYTESRLLFPGPAQARNTKTLPTSTMPGLLTFMSSSGGSGYLRFFPRAASFHVLPLSSLGRCCAYACTHAHSDTEVQQQEFRLYVPLCTCVLTAAVTNHEHQPYTFEPHLLPADVCYRELPRVGQWHWRYRAGLGAEWTRFRCYQGEIDPHSFEATNAQQKLGVHTPPSVCTPR